MVLIWCSLFLCIVGGRESAGTARGKEISENNVPTMRNKLWELGRKHGKSSFRSIPTLIEVIEIWTQFRNSHTHAFHSRSMRSLCCHGWHWAMLAHATRLLVLLLFALPPDFLQVSSQQIKLCILVADNGFRIRCIFAWISHIGLKTLTSNSCV